MKQRELSDDLRASKAEEGVLHSQNGPAETFRLMDQADARPLDGPWRREDVYRERLR